MPSDLHRQCAQMFMVGFPDQELDPGLEQLLGAGVFGAIFFARNIGAPQEVSALCRKIKERAGRPFVLAVDQEGGRVARLRGSPFAALPAMRALGRGRDVALAQRCGRLLAFELRAVGFDWDFAPVLDVDTNPRNPVIGDRALHSEAAEVARLGVALARGLEAGDVASCGKHFPGHGDTAQDSHLTLPRLAHDIERLRSVELVPFGAYAKAELAALMTAHVMFEAVDPGVPATMSSRVLQDVLRGELDFQGVIVSDDLEMKAIGDFFPLEEAVARGALAGVDLFLVCHRAEAQHRAIEGLVRAVEAGRVPLRRIEESNQRLASLAKRFAHPPEDLFALLGSAEHRHLAEGLSSLAQGHDPTEGPA